MKVREGMHEDATFVAPSTRIAAVARQMRDADSGALPVKADGKLVGIVTDRDIGCRALADGKDPEQVTAMDVMTSRVVCCLSPRALGLTYETAATINSLVSGIVVTAVAAVALNKTYDWEEFLSLAIGLWVVIAPWVLGFTDGGFVLWTQVATGPAVAAVAGFEIWRLFGSPETRSI